MKPRELLMYLHAILGDTHYAQLRGKRDAANKIAEDIRSELSGRGVIIAEVSRV